MTLDEAKSELSKVQARTAALWTELNRLDALVKPVRAEWYDSKEYSSILESFIRLSETNTTHTTP